MQTIPFRFTSPILLQMGVFLYPSADDISYSMKKGRLRSDLFTGSM